MSKNIDKNKIQQQDEILKAIETMIIAYDRNTKYDRTQWGIITAINVNGTLKIMHNDFESDLPVKFEVDITKLIVGDVVIIRIPSNNFSQRYVDGKRPF